MKTDYGQIKVKGISVAITGTVVLSLLVSNAHGISAYEMALVRDRVDSEVLHSIPIETDYIPNLVQAENGWASYEALKAQAVAARTYLYYKMETTGWISDGTKDQVYSDGYLPLRQHLDASLATEREILRYRDSSGQFATIAAFYVAGARPDSNTGTAGFGVAEVPPDYEYSNIERYVTYNHGRIGNYIHQTTLGYVSNTPSGNPRNRGAMSQNGSDYLSDHGWNYVDILRYYYGADIRLVMATTPDSGILAQTKILSDYELDHGYFNRSPQYAAGSNDNIAYTESTYIECDDQQSYTGKYSQKISIQAVDSRMPFTMNLIAGIGTTGFGTAVANLSFELRGTLGVWILSTTPGLEVSLILDTTSGTYAGRNLSITHDGSWHCYLWQLDDPLWWSTLQGDSIISGSASLDTMLIRGVGHAILNMDDLFTTPLGPFLNQLR